MGLSILIPTKSEIYGLIGFAVFTCIMVYIQQYFGGKFDMTTSIIVLVGVFIYHVICNVSIDIEVSNK
jgi:hypothetical protein